MAKLDAPKIVTAHIGNENSHTLDAYLAAGGYQGLRKALEMGPEAVQAEVDAANIAGRGGAGFPAGRKWSMLRKADPVYLVVNGDESEPATFKDLQHARVLSAQGHAQSDCEYSQHTWQSGCHPHRCSC